MSWNPYTHEAGTYMHACMQRREGRDLVVAQVWVCCEDGVDHVLKLAAQLVPRTVADVCNAVSDVCGDHGRLLTLGVLPERADDVEVDLVLLRVLHRDACTTVSECCAG